ncbi:uncharacterized protein LOC135267901 [Tribolium castaneum]|uniref:uncharacterized protein LOC135267901 n=1 Tax=Tribolium castaneum TaxID=7070 RepID=UPI0030FE089B
MANGASDLEFSCDFLLCPNLTSPMILGLDFIMEQQLVLNFETGEISRQGQVLVCVKTPLTLVTSERTDSDVSTAPSEPVETATATVDTAIVGDGFVEREIKNFAEVQGRTDMTVHEIRLTNPTPIKQWYRPQNPAMQQIIDEEVDRMLTEDIIEPSESPWSSPIVLADKKDGRKKRFCIDFRKINSVSQKDAYPIPHINGILDKLPKDTAENSTGARTDQPGSPTLDFPASG